MSKLSLLSFLMITSFSSVSATPQEGNASDGIAGNNGTKLRVFTALSEIVPWVGKGNLNTTKKPAKKMQNPGITHIPRTGTKRFGNDKVHGRKAKQQKQFASSHSE